MLSSEQVRRLLTDLCDKLGLCLSVEDHRRLSTAPPQDPRSFTEAVFLTEGIDREVVDPRLYRKVKTMVEDAFATPPPKSQKKQQPAKRPKRRRR